MSFFVGENIPLREVLEEPYSDEIDYARDLLQVLHGGLKHLIDHKAEAGVETTATVSDASEPAAFPGRDA